MACRPGRCLNTCDVYSTQAQTRRRCAGVFPPSPGRGRPGATCSPPAGFQTGGAGRTSRFTRWRSGCPSRPGTASDRDRNKEGPLTAGGVVQDTSQDKAGVWPPSEANKHPSSKSVDGPPGLPPTSASQSPWSGPHPPAQDKTQACAMLSAHPTCPPSAPCQALLSHSPPPST